MDKPEATFGIRIDTTRPVVWTEPTPEFTAAYHEKLKREEHGMGWVYHLFHAGQITEAEFRRRVRECRLLRRMASSRERGKRRCRS